MNTRFTIALHSATIVGRYTSRRSVVISYIFIGVCSVALLYLILKQMKSHK